MNDSNTEVSFIEYKKSFINKTEKDGYNSSESKESRKKKMPGEDRPPRNQSWSDMGKMNKTKCVYNYSVPQDMFDGEGTELQLKAKGKAKVSVTLNDNGTYTIETCYKKQFKPKRRKRDGSYTNKSSMSNATKEYWKDYGEADGGPDSVESVDYIDMDGVHEMRGQPKDQNGR